MNGPLPSSTTGPLARRSLSRVLAGMVRRQDGGALVEIALLLPMLVFTFLAAVDLALIVQSSMVVEDAALAGARYGATAGHGQDTAGMQTVAQNAAVGVSSFNVSSAYFCTCSPGGSQVSCTSSCSSLASPAQYEQVSTKATVPVLFSVPGLPSTYAMSFTTTLRGTPGGQ